MRYYSNKEYVLRNIAGENVLVSIRSSVADFSGVVTLNRSAAVLWESLQTGATLEELVQIFTKKFEVDEAEAEADLREMLTMLEARKMITHE